MTIMRDDRMVQVKSEVKGEKSRLELTVTLREKNKAGISEKTLRTPCANTNLVPAFKSSNLRVM